MTTREIQGHLKELYQVDESPAPISAVTDAVKEDVRAWPVPSGLRPAGGSHRQGGAVSDPAAPTPGPSSEIGGLAES